MLANAAHNVVRICPLGIARHSAAVVLSACRLLHLSNVLRAKRSCNTPHEGEPSRLPDPELNGAPRSGPRRKATRARTALRLMQRACGPGGGIGGAATSARGLPIQVRRHRGHDQGSTQRRARDGDGLPRCKDRCSERGGSSTRRQGGAREEFSLDLPLASVFESPTIGNISVIIEELIERSRSRNQEREQGVI